MRRWLVVCALLAGCESGVVIEVHAHPSVTTTDVELFLGLEPCDGCTAIKPDIAPFPLEGDVYYRDDADVFVATMVDGVARFRIEPGDEGQVLRTIVAVGLTSDRQTAAALLPGVVLDRAQKWVVQLEPATMQLRPPAGPADGDFVHIWREQLDPASSCIAFERWHRDELASRTFVVPRHDPDCDDFTGDTKECNEYAHASSLPPELDEVSCTLSDNSGPMNGACMLGGPTCTDGAGTDDCGPSDYCVPDEICARCANASATADLRECFVQVYGGSAVPGPIVHCLIPMVPNNDGTSMAPCPGMELIAGKFDPEFPSGCSGARLAVVPQLGSPPAELLGPLTQSIQLAAGDGAHVLTLKARLPLPGNTCTIPFEVSGAAKTGVLRAAPAAIELTASFDDKPHKHLLLPLVITPNAGCFEPGECRIEGDANATVLQCTR